MNYLTHTHMHTHIWLVQVVNEMMMNECLYESQDLFFRLIDIKLH